MALRRIFAPIPTSGPLGPFGIQRSNSISWFVPSDVQGTNVKIRGANRDFSAGSGSAVSTNFALYTSDGADRPLGAALGTATVVLPGNGTVASSGNLGPVVRGADGKLVVLYDLNDPVFVNTNIQYGFYSDGTIVVSPPPAVTGVNTTSEYWLELEFNSAKDFYLLFTDSIGNGFGSSFEQASWNLFAQQNNVGVCIEGMVQIGSLQNFANNVGLPFLYDEVTPAGTHGVMQVGTNDLAYNDLITMQNSAIACIANMKAIGCVDVSAWTIPPETGYPGTEVARLGYNAWLKANRVALGLRCIYDAAAPQSQGGLAKDGDPSVIAPAFDSGDGTHPNAAGQVQINNGWTAAFAASAGGGIAVPNFIPPIAPPLLYPPFPRTANVEPATVGAPVPSSINAGTATPAPAPPMTVPPPLRSGSVSFTPAATIAPNLTNISPVTTQRQINTTFRIVDLRLNNQAP